MERLQKVIAQAGICSRRKAEELITNGAVTVNGKVVTELGTKVDESDKITVNGKPLYNKEKLVYLVLNKPRNTVATVSDDRGRKTVLDCIENVKQRISERVRREVSQGASRKRDAILDEARVGS